MDCTVYATMTCSKTQYINCTMAHSITGTKCQVTNRKKRNTQKSFDKEMKRLFMLMNDKYNGEKTQHRRTKVCLLHMKKAPNRQKENTHRVHDK